MKVNILGTEYEIVIGNEQDYPYLKQVDGFCDPRLKELLYEIVKVMKKTRPHFLIWKNTRGKLQGTKSYMPTYRKVVYKAILNTQINGVTKKL